MEPQNLQRAIGVAAVRDATDAELREILASDAKLTPAATKYLAERVLAVYWNFKRTGLGPEGTIHAWRAYWDPRWSAKEPGQIADL